nr:MAG TPA: hypothetical protein [Bacteriophage sp.]
MHLPLSVKERGTRAAAPCPRQKKPTAIEPRPLSCG